MRCLWQEEAQPPTALEQYDSTHRSAKALWEMVLEDVSAMHRCLDGWGVSSAVAVEV
jgi:hypothetical protein